MPTLRLKQVTEALRYRVERGLSMRALRGGDRLPSTRELALELKTNARVVLAAYKALAAEGLVEIRERSGNYVAPRNLISSILPPPPTPVVVDILADAVTRGYSTQEFSGYLADAAYGSRLSAAVIASTADQAEGISRELINGLSLSTLIVSPDALKRRTEIPPALRRADLLVATEGYRERVTRIAEALRIPYVIVTMRSDIITEEWQALMRRGINVVAADPNFLALLRTYLARSPQAGSIKMFVAGVDSLDSIGPTDASYVTAAARKRLGGTRIPGTLVSPPRFLSEACVRAILTVIVSLRFGHEEPRRAFSKGASREVSAAQQ